MSVGRFPFVVPFFILFFSPTCQREVELPQTFAFNAKLRQNETNRFRELKSETFELSGDTAGQREEKKKKNTHGLTQKPHHTPANQSHSGVPGDEIRA